MRYVTSINGLLIAASYYKPVVPTFQVGRPNIKKVLTSFSKFLFYLSLHFNIPKPHIIPV